MFRWRRRGGQQSAGPEPGDGDYPAAEDELAEEDAQAVREPEAEGWAGEEWADEEETGADRGFSAVGEAGWAGEGELAGEEVAGEGELAGEELAGEELADEELADEELADEELADEELAGEELAGEELADEELADEELADEELADEELADEELAGEDEWAEDELVDEDEGELTGTRRAGGAVRRRRAARADLGDPDTWTRLRDTQAVSPAMTRSAGPWDAASGYPDAERFDFGSLLVPVRDGFDVQVFVSDQQGISIAVVHGESGLQLQPFAAPRSSGLWHEVLPELADEVAKAGGQSRQQEGPFGPELVARVVPQGAEGTRVPPQPLRFIGADGPRWFLRGLISGPAARDEELARPLEEIFADVVVVRGDHAEPPRKPLDIRLPDEARQVLESQLEEQQQTVLNPLERGPEITETR